MARPHTAQTFTDQISQRPKLLTSHCPRRGAPAQPKSAAFNRSRPRLPLDPARVPVPYSGGMTQSRATFVAPWFSR